MPFQSVPNCAIAVVEGIIDSQPIANVLGFQTPTLYSQGDIDALSAAVDTEFAVNVLPLLHSTYTYVQTAVRGLTSPIDLQSINGTGTGPGGTGGDALPSNVAFCLTEYTGKSGRSARGRIYIPGIPASITATANTLSPTPATAFVTAYEAIFSTALTAGWTHVIISRVNNGAIREFGIGTPVTQIVHRNLILDSQRGRLPKGH
jgi:hypothetical protein